MMTDWNYDMAAAPKDRPILGWSHGLDDCPDCGPKELCLFHAHAEGLGAVEDGPHVLVWGGGFTDVGEYGVVEAALPDWWFRQGSEFEEAANPIAWAEITEATIPAREPRPMMLDENGNRSIFDDVDE